MIEITDELKRLKNTLCSTFGLCKVADKALAYIFSEALRICNKEKTDQQLIDLLKERGYSEPPKWVEFNANDESTYPPVDELNSDRSSFYVLSQDNEIVFYSYEEKGWLHKTEQDDFWDVTHWCELPTPPEEKS